MRDPGSEDDVGLAIEAPRGGAAVRRFSHEAMATVFEVFIVYPDERYASQAAHEAFNVADRLERELSRFIPNSDIARINALAAGEATLVSGSTLECLLIARHMFDLTGGAFDVSLGTGLAMLDLDPDRVMVRATANGVRIDLGGIGKGYAVDLMADLLEEWGLPVALVHGGFSSVMALESPAGSRGWPLTFSDPGNSSRVLRRLTMSRAALGASGLRKGDHIVDPRSGEPVRGRLAAWVAVRRPEQTQTGAETIDGPVPRPAAVADALTTAFMILPADQIDRLCSLGLGTEAWVLPGSGNADADDIGLLHFGAAAG